MPCTAPSATSNTANCDYGGPYDLTDLGSYTGSGEPNGTFDQGGNVIERTEAILDSRRIQRSGALLGSWGLAADFRNWGYPTFDDASNLGFRVAPEPAARDLLVILGMLGIACLENRRV